MLTIIAYDIPDNKRRQRIAKTLLNYGNRVQYSVFECHLSPKRLGKLQQELHQIFDEKKDKIYYYRLCQSCLKASERSGIEEVTIEEPLLYFAGEKITQ